MKGVIFDMDGVLFDTETVWMIYWYQKAEEMGITLGDSFKKDVCGTSDDLMVQIVNRYYKTNHGREIIEDVRQRMKEHVKKELPEKPGLHEILKNLKEKGFRLAIASSTGMPTILSNCERAGICDCFDAIVSGQEVKRGKPAPDIFRLAAERLELTNEECYVIEDAYNGIRAANAAGSKPIMVVDQVEPDEEIRKLCAFVTHSLDEAWEFISEVDEREMKG